MSNEIDRDTLPDNMKGTFDDLQEFIEEYINHHICIEYHEAEIKRLREEIEPRITLVSDHLKSLSHLRVFGEFMDSLDDEG